jgi:hypothetical protein
MSDSRMRVGARNERRVRPQLPGTAGPARRRMAAQVKLATGPVRIDVQTFQEYSLCRKAELGRARLLGWDERFRLPFD